MPLAVCATPIGNLEDVTLRVLRELAEAELVLCEDTRHTGKLLERHGIRARLLSYHEHNEAARTAEVLPRLQAGERIALASDAGLPAVSDPGARLIAAAIEAGVPVTVLPGPSAVETALVASGLVGERYQFVGYLPRGERALRALWEELAAWPHPVVAFESPRRLPASLASLAEAHPTRPVAVCRELTKRFEEVVRGSAAEVAERYSEPPKGEITVVVGSAPDDRGRRRAGSRGGCRARRRGGRAPSRGGDRLAADGRGAQPPLSSFSVARFDNSRPPCYRAGSWFSKLATECPCTCSPWWQLSPSHRRPAPGAGPSTGPVLRGFLAEDDPYLGGQHRGVDIGALSGAEVRAPARGVVAFAGSVPHAGLGVTIRTEDGYSITLIHLGSVGVRVGTAVEEGEGVGTVGPSGEVEHAEPYVHLGIRVTAEPHGYLDPLSLLPARASQTEPTAAPTVPAPSQISVATGSSSAPVRRARSAPTKRASSRARTVRDPAPAVRRSGGTKVVSDRIQVVAPASVRPASGAEKATAPVSRRCRGADRAAGSCATQVGTSTGPNPRGARPRHSEREKPATRDLRSRHRRSLTSPGWLSWSGCRSASGSSSSGSSDCAVDGSRRGRR